MPDSSPSDFILARVDAFRRCDFGFIFDSYHPQSSFRRQFPDRDEYIRYGWGNLGKEFRILVCRVVREEIAGSTAQLIFWLEFEIHGVRQRYAELAWLEEAGEGWCYRCGQKLEADAWPVPAAQLDFVHFEAVAEKVMY